MTSPTYERLEAAFPGKGRELKKVMTGDIDPKEYSDVLDWLEQCHGLPKRVELVMCALNQIIEGHGVEAIFGDRVHWPDLEYVNMGDAYTTTLMYDHIDGNYLLTSYGNWIEWRESTGRIYE